MSRKGKLPIAVTKGVEVQINGQQVNVKGPKGNLQLELIAGVDVQQDGDILSVQIGEDPEMGKFQGLYRTLISNMIEGVTKGFEKRLELIGVGYRAAVSGAKLDLQLGFSHPLLLDIPEGINITVEKNTKIIVQGCDKQAVGQFAALIREKRKPEPYKGKGVRYEGEYVRKKAGKAGRAAK